MEDAGELIYSSGLDMTRSETFRPVGVTCRLCERLDCIDRAHPTLVHGAERALAEETRAGPKLGRKSDRAADGAVAAEAD